MALTDSEKTGLLFKKVFAGKSSTDDDRAFFEEPKDGKSHVASTDVWSEAHLIPNSGIGDLTGSVAAGSSVTSGVVTYYSASGFGGVPGATNAYTSSVLKNVIPFNYGDGATYKYVLLSNKGTEIPQADSSDWTFDTETGTLIFFSGNPTNIGADNDDDVSPSLPPSMSAYVYIGKTLDAGLATGDITAGDLNLTNITASGNISASGDLYVDGTSFVNDISASGDIIGSGFYMNDATGSVNFYRPVNDILLPHDIWRNTFEPLSGSYGLTITDWQEKVAQTTFVSVAGGNQPDGGHSVALTTGNAMIIYADGDDDDGKFLIVDPAGNVVKPITIFRSGTGSIRSITSTTLTNGNVLIAYKDSTDSSKGKFTIVDSAGNLVNSGIIFASDGISNPGYSSVTALTNGNAFIAYSSDDDQGKFVIVDPAGNIVKSGTVFKDGAAYNISTTTLTNGNVFIAYTDYDSSGEGQFVIYDSAGNLIKSETTYSTNAIRSNNDSISLTNGNVMIVYDDDDNGDKGYVAVYTSVGNVVVEPKLWGVRAFGQGGPKGRILPNGNVLVVYTDDNLGYLVILDPVGNIIKSETAFSSAITTSFVPTILTNGNVLITYKDNEDNYDGKFVIWESTGPKFTKTLTVDGDITASGNITASGTVYASSFDNVVATNITASGDISASSTGSFGHIFTEGTSYLGTTAAGTYKVGGNVFIGSELTVGGSNVGYGVHLNGTPGWGAGYWFDTDNGCGIYGAGSNKDYMRFRVSPENVTIMELTNHDVTINGHITASGNISASGDIFKEKNAFLYDGGVVVDTYSTGSYRTAKYILQVSSGSHYNASEVLLLHSGSRAYLTEYAALDTGVDLIRFRTDVDDSGYVRLIASSSFESCSIKYDRTLISK